MMPSLPKLYFALVVFYKYTFPSDGKQVNVALHKPVFQSGNLNYSGHFWKAETSVDGYKSCSTVNSTYYSGTAYREKPWWQVDLGRTFNISSIKIYGKGNPSKSTQYNGYGMFVTTSNDTRSATNLSTSIDNRNPGFDLKDGPIIGRYITLQLPNLPRTHILVLCEVEVFADAINVASRSLLEATTKLNYSTYSYKRENAVDGKVPTNTMNSDSCNCCYCSENTSRPFLRALFNTQHVVYSIEIQGRHTNKGDASNLSRLKVYLDGQSANVTLSDRKLRAVIVPNNVLLANVTIEKENQGFLMICELKIFVIECVDGYYGPNCNNSCGHCESGSSCNKSNGVCPNGCRDGYKEQTCISECDEGYYGQNCNNTCGHCELGSSCNKSNGMCPTGCSPGYKGQNCNSECDEGYYGKNCYNTCGHCELGSSCNKSNGMCPTQCSPGYQGRNCNSVCNHGTYGENCSSVCRCLDGRNCTNEFGYCPDGLCAAGWQGESCNTVCNQGTYGENCSSVCHCLHGQNCTNEFGYCPDGLCAAGWQGESCNTVCNHGTYGENCSSVCRCLDGRNCTNEFGYCPEGLCAAGWQGESCNTVCNQGTYGENCSSECHCLHGQNCTNDFGYCPDGLCAAGWQGESCNTVCNQGTYGENCSSVCHCLHGQNCTNDFGYCSDGLCAAGWQGESCNTECVNGAFGPSCTKLSHCINGTGNDPKTGRCDENACEPGWRNESCDTECAHRTYGLHCNQSCGHCKDNACDKVTGNCTKGCDDNLYTDYQCVVILRQIDNNEGSKLTIAAVGGALGAVLVIAVAILVVFIWRRKISKHSSGGDVSLQVSKKEPEFQRHPSSASIEEQEEISVCEDNEGVADEEHAYYSFSPSKLDIRPSQLWHYIRKMQEDECQAFFQEFKTLPYGLKLAYKEAMRPENRPKNRYREMYAYDHSRVVLQITGPDQTDYINANYVHGFEKTQKFIASQGPTDKMINDFWRMVWQQKSTNIVMLTNCIENGSKKCEKYWPDDDEVLTYGIVNVKVIKTDIHTDYNQREMEITMGNEPARTVTQFHFKSWPDKDVPDSTWCLVNFWRAVTKEQRTPFDTPIIVHCSAGIGRTGTYIALDYLYNQAQTTGAINPLLAVQSLRRQRVNLVQTQEQYAYLHEAVADAMGMGTHFVWGSQFEDVYNYMTHIEQGSSKPPLENQFDLVVESLAEIKDTNPSATTVYEDTYVNDGIATEIDAYRPKIKKRSSKHVQEMGAMYLPAFSGASAFLVAKSPTDKSLVEFWSLVQEENIKTVISLCESTAKNYKACTHLGAESSTLTGIFEVNALDTKTTRSHTARSYVHWEHGKNEEESRATVKVFDYTAWKSSYNTPAEAMSMLELLEAVNNWQPHVSESQPILIHCNTGARRSGVVCLILSELQRLKREDGQINILDSLMRIKERNDKIIENAGQYQFCHDVIRTYLQQQQQQEQQSENLYANL